MGNQPGISSLDRCKRLRIKVGSTISGLPRIFSIFDRGILKHPGDLALWMSYLEHIRKVKGHQEVQKGSDGRDPVTPYESELWLYAARWALESDSDMGEARSWMQRGTRFCTTSTDLWIEYAKLEMIYLLKIAMRRKILGLDVGTSDSATKESENAPADSVFDPRRM